MAFTVYKGVNPSEIPDRLRYNGVSMIANSPYIEGVNYYYDSEHHQGCYIPEINEVAIVATSNRVTGSRCGICISTNLGDSPWTSIEDTTNKFVWSSFICPTGIEGRYVIGYTNNLQNGFLQVTNDSFATLDPTLYLGEPAYDVSAVMLMEYREDDNEIFLVKYHLNYSSNGGTLKIFYLDPSDLSIKEQYSTSYTSPFGITYDGMISSNGSNRIVATSMGSTNIIYSEDRGATWTQSANTRFMSGSSGQVIGDTAISYMYDTSTADYLFCRSADGGETWSPITDTGVNTTGYHFKGTYKEGDIFKAFTQVPTGVANRYTTHLMESVDDGLTWRDDPNMQIVTNENYYLTKSIPISGGSRMLTGYTQFYINKNFGF